MSDPGFEEEQLRWLNEERLYSDVSDEEDFTDCRKDFDQNCNKLERGYFEKLHIENVEPNETYVDSPVLAYRKPMTEFEEAHFHEYNVTPDRPCSAYFKTDSFMPAADVFEALRKDGFKCDHVRCLQRKPTGEIFLTFHTQQIRDAFLSKSPFIMKRRSYAINDDEWPLTFLTIYDAPYELSDAAIIHRLSPYCGVVWYRRGTFEAHGGVFDGLRHYRFAIPSFLCFEKFQIRMYYNGQMPTCRKCNRSGHKAAECKHTVCFNCDGLGHVSKECVRPMYCCICKSGQHLARTCPLSWHREKDSSEQQPESQDTAADYGASDDRGAASDRNTSADREEVETFPDNDEDIVIADEREEPHHSADDLTNDDGTVNEDVLNFDEVAVNDIDVSNACEVSQLDASADYTPLPPSTPTLSELDVSDAKGP